MNENASKRPLVLAVVGPTASGKTSAAIKLAKKLGGEIISCDSMQIYRGMDIGTAKPTKEETEGVPHHMIDVADPGRSFSCADYAEMAKKCVEDILSRGKLPIFCGGTGLYLDAVLTGNRFAEIKSPPELRERLMNASPEENYARLSAIDPETALATHPNNIKRVVRALEIYETTGITKTELDKRSRDAEIPYDARVLGLDFRDRSKLYERIDRRVDEMFRLGLLDEVRRLAPVLKVSETAGQAIGYKETLRYLDGEITLNEASGQIKQASRNYAKRQLTWFRHSKTLEALMKWKFIDETTADEENNAAELVNNLLNLLNV